MSISVFTSPIPDRRAITLASPQYPVHADGVGDDTPALQAAIDEAYSRDGGIVLIPEGVYRLGSTVYLWRGVRLIGYGAQRPVFVLAPDTPGFQGPESAYLIQFCDRRLAGQPIIDAKNTTFFSGIANVDVEIGKGNPGAVAMRFFVAQHSNLRHIEFRLGGAKAALEQVGNDIEHCRFVGGQWAILAGRTSAGWQTLLLDCAFEGQARGSIRTEMAGMTIMRCRFADTPQAIVVPEGKVEQLYLKESHCERVGTGITADATDRPEMQLSIDTLTCRDTPAFMDLRGAEVLRAPGRGYTVEQFSLGLHVGEGKDDPSAPSGPLHAAVSLPPMHTWVSAADFGAVGDGEADDTAALQAALADGRPVFLPIGHYRITDTLTLREDGVLIGLHPRKTRLWLGDHTAGFTDADAPKAMLHAPSGAPHVTGIGMYPGLNPGAVMLLWEAGPDSCVDDVFPGAGQHPRDYRGTQAHYGVLVRGGGGTFKNIWTAYQPSKAGFVVENTEVPGQCYLLSIEHHLTEEVILRNVRGWCFYALQTEENLGSEGAVSLRAEHCRNLLFANYFAYRVMAIRQPHPHAVALTDCTDITWRGLHVFSLGPCPYDAAIEANGQVIVSTHEAAVVRVR